MSNRILTFKQILESFENESMRRYCEDLIDRTPLNYWCYATKAYNCPGGLIIQTLVGCQICNNLLSLEESKLAYPMPKLRDGIRIAACFRYVDKTDWIRDTVVSHDIKKGIKDYIADIIDSFSDYANIRYTEDPKALIYLCDTLSIKTSISDETKERIRREAVPDPELFFFKDGPYKKMNFWLVYQLDKNYLYELRDSGKPIQEPLQTYLKELL